MHKRTKALLAAGLLLPALAGCSRSEPEEQPTTTVENDAGVVETAPVEEPTPVMTNDAEPAPINMAADTVPPPPPERTVDQQMLDDASATGMTARVQRTPSNDAPPADAAELKDGQ
ncbi:hypothetical protein [Sphingomonas sp. Leaf21]|uniref:hypothetical protein n=1 Tax=Sphingomonas sp. Leaf21 TaxID=2876550 RepID=UPI001E58F7A8|nr:hypothetical protein [Sphingomonas sp. Leaf21]